MQLGTFEFPTNLAETKSFYDSEKFKFSWIHNEKMGWAGKAGIGKDGQVRVRWMINCNCWDLRMGQVNQWTPS